MSHYHLHNTGRLLCGTYYDDTECFLGHRSTREQRSMMYMPSYALSLSDQLQSVYCATSGLRVQVVKRCLQYMSTRSCLQLVQRQVEPTLSEH